MARQFFYLVVCNYDESTWPQKIFLQEHQAIQWGRRQATKARKEGFYCHEFDLYKQEIARSATLKFVKTLEPYKEDRGADLDIDKATPKAKRTPCYEEDIF